VSLTPNQITEIKQAALSAIESAEDLDALKNVKISHVGDRSPIAKANQMLSQIPIEERATLGKLIGSARADINQAHDDRERKLKSDRDSITLNKESVDTSIAPKRTSQGALHPLTQLRHEIEDLFTGLGYEVVEGPELESGWLNFDALNIPVNHPARTMQDTFFIEPLQSDLVLRTQTSPVQIRTMLERKPPIFVICPGRTFRSDALDATHSPVFNQVEGLVVDKGITMADLKGTLSLFAARIFGQDVETRIRPSYFPFTEPSAEVDFFYNGKWIEWGGCGMVNPKVLKVCGIDPDTYSGFAFGMGLERTLMVRHGITDMHDIVEGDVRFSRSFGNGIR
jgi:phenylalanyl-tRNA synthetase alpha chain